MVDSLVDSSVDGGVPGLESRALELKAMKNDQSPLLRPARGRRSARPRALAGARYVPAVLTAASMLGYLTFGCEPDLDSLSADFDENGNEGGTPGLGGTDGEGGDGPGTGGTSGSSGGSGGKGGSSGSSGKGGSSSGATGGSSGDAGSGGSSGSTSGNGGSSGSTGGTNTTTACTNGSRGANESDVDCGGDSDCPRCENNLRCTKASDCESNWCFSGRCAEPTCADDRKNQDETGVDCGGVCAPASACDDGVACAVDDDCKSEYCVSDVCADHCTSDRREADETDVNCGGADCAPCAGDLRCETGPDCESGLCANNVCTFASCEDNFQNQDESDTDCGGVCGPEKFCEVGDDCNSPADCETYVCTDGECADDLDIPTADMLDDMEDGNQTIPALGGRVGGWYGFNDGNGSNTWENGLIPGQRGALSTRAQHTAGSGYSTWGSGIGFDLFVDANGKNVYDASAYAGVTFWAKSATPMSLTVAFPDVNTTGQLPAAIKRCTSCDHHWLTSVSMSTEWQRFTILWTDLQLEGGTEPPPDPLEPAITQLVSVQFRVATNSVYDYWVDDVAFVVAE
jgi:hypothetical protein